MLFCHQSTLTHQLAPLRARGNGCSRTRLAPAGNKRPKGRFATRGARPHRRIALQLSRPPAKAAQPAGRPAGWRPAANRRQAIQVLASPRFEFRAGSPPRLGAPALAVSASRACMTAARRCLPVGASRRRHPSTIKDNRLLTFLLPWRPRTVRVQEWEEKMTTQVFRRVFRSKTTLFGQSHECSPKIVCFQKKLTETSGKSPIRGFENAKYEKNRSTQ